MRTLALTLLLVLLPASASAAGTAASRHSKVALAACDTDTDTATFRGSMTRMRRAPALQMRFTLQARVPGGGGFKRVVAPPGSTFDTWLSSSSGKRGYVFDKVVENLEDGASYRAVVRFRWRGRDGDVVARTTKATRACKQPDPRPNLRVRDITVRPGTSPQTRTYVVRVVNRGRSEAPAFATGLSVDGAALPDRAAGPLGAGDETRVSFVAARCSEGSSLTATADTTAAVDERRETDNVLAVPCPTGVRRNGPASA